MIGLILGNIMVVLGVFSIIKGKLPLIKRYNGVKNIKLHSRIEGTAILLVGIMLIFQCFISLGNVEIVIIILSNKERELVVKNWKNQLAFHSMLLPGVVLLLIFSVAPMFGIVMAFQDFVPAKGILGSSFVGLKYFKLLLKIQSSEIP